MASLGHASSVQRYNGVARALHWTIAIMVIGNIAGGLLHDPLEDYVRLMPTHKALGMTVLALTIVRLAWRMTWTRPPLPADIAPWQRVSSGIVHGLLYVLLLVMPISGWIATSAGKYPLSWFGLFDIYKFDITRESAAYAAAHETHELLGWAMLALVLMHVGAALYHHFVLKDAVLRQMA